MKRSDSLQSVDLPAEFFDSDSDEERLSDLVQLFGTNSFENGASKPKLSSAEDIAMNRSRMKLLSIMSHFAASSKKYNSLSYDFFRMGKATRDFVNVYLKELYEKYPLISQIPDVESLIEVKNKLLHLGQDVDFESRDITELLKLCSHLYRQLHAYCWPKQSRPLPFVPQTGTPDEIAQSLKNNLRFLDEGIDRNNARIKECNKCKTRMMAFLLKD